VSEVGGRFSTLVEAGEFCERDACAGAHLAKGKLLLQSRLPCRGEYMLGATPTCRGGCGRCLSAIGVDHAVWVVGPVIPSASGPPGRRTGAARWLPCNSLRLEDYPHSDKEIHLSLQQVESYRVKRVERADLSQKLVRALERAQADEREQLLELRRCTERRRQVFKMQQV
jgi:hypothetical protein